MLEESESASAIPSSIWASMNSWFTPTVLFVLLNLMIATIAFTSTLSSQRQNHNHQQNQKNSQNDPHRPNIAKSPSSVLQRLKSINFHTHFRSQEPQNSSIYHKPNPDSDTLFNISHTHKNIETQSHYFFQDTNSQENLENPTQTQAHYVLEQTHENNLQENRAHFDYDKKDSSSDDFQQAREEKVVEESNEQSMDEVYSQLTDSHFSRIKSDTEPASGEFPTKLSARMRKSASLKSAFGHFEEEIVETRRPATVREKGNAKVTECDEEVDAKADDFINRFKQQLKLQRLDSIIRYKDMIGSGSGGK